MREPGIVEPSRSLDSQLDDLVHGPLLVSLNEGGVTADDPYLIIIDGLDECADKEGIATFIDSSIRFFSCNPDVPLRLFITSRVEEHIRTHVEDGMATIHLVDLAYRSSRADIRRYMTSFFTEAKKHDRALQALGELWPVPEDLDQLVGYCDGSFIFGSTLARFILHGLGERDPRTPMERLPLALKVTPGIDGVYTEILSSARHLPHFHTIIPTLACVFTPLSISATAALLGLSTYDIIRVVVALQAVLHVPGRDDEPVTVFHTSFRDFLLYKNRSRDDHCPPSHHTCLMHRCLGLLFGSGPTTNTECCKYALIYWGAHFNAGACLDPAFDLDGLQRNTPYEPIDRREWETRDYKSRRGEGRHVSFAISVTEWFTMTENISAPSQLFPMSPGRHYRVIRNIDPNRWSFQSSGPGQSMDLLKSLHVCSFGDIVQGLRLLRERGGLDRVLSVLLKRGSGTSIMVKGSWLKGEAHSQWGGWEVAIEQSFDTE